MAAAPIIVTSPLILLEGVGSRSERKALFPLSGRGPIKTLVEVKGIEPLSGDLSALGPTCVACVFSLAFRRPHRQGHRLASPFDLTPSPGLGKKASLLIPRPASARQARRKWTSLRSRQREPTEARQLLVFPPVLREGGHLGTPPQPPCPRRSLSPPFSFQPSAFSFERVQRSRCEVQGLTSNFEP